MKKLGSCGYADENVSIAVKKWVCVAQLTLGFKAVGGGQERLALAA
jgi:hypothetical protein